MTDLEIVERAVLAIPRQFRSEYRGELYVTLREACSEADADVEKIRRLRVRLKHSFRTDQAKRLKRHPCGTPTRTFSSLAAADIAALKAKTTCDESEIDDMLVPLSDTQRHVARMIAAGYSQTDIGAILLIGNQQKVSRIVREIRSLLSNICPDTEVVPCRPGRKLSRMNAFPRRGESPTNGETHCARIAGSSTARRRGEHCEV